MRIFVLNSGSSSIKYKLFNGDLKLLKEGIVESVIDHKEALTKIEESLNLDFVTLDAIAHRVVHGGLEFTKPTFINKQVIDEIKKTIPLAPLHNRANLDGIIAFSKLTPTTPQIAFFDTAFHQTMLPSSYLYAIPKKYYRDMGIRRYGFHGISHQYLLKESAKRLNKPIEQCNIITLHLGNGASVTAIKNGKVIDTSMGFTPLEGLVMGTRVGDIDGGILIYLQEKLKLSPDEINHILNYRSGLKGICGTNDMREIIQNMKQGDKDSSLAFKIFCLKIKKYIGSYIALIGKIDAIVFSGGIGENSQEVRDEVCKEMEHLGVTSKKIFVIKTNEELEMARETIKILNHRSIKLTQTSP
jgi:acetate kinase